MFINKDLLEFFGSMMEIKKQKRDIFNTLAFEVDDPEIRETLLSIGLNEQQQVDNLQQSLNLVNGGPYLDLVDQAKPSPLAALQPKGDGEQKPAQEVLPDILQKEELSKLESDITDLSIPVVPKLVPADLDITPSETSRTEANTNIYLDRPASKPLTVQSPLQERQKEWQPPVPPNRQNIGLVRRIESRETTRNSLSTPSQTSYSMNTFKHPLAEVFGFTTTDPSSKAQRYRSHRHCPFNNKVPNCTNEQTKNPLGVCSILHDNKSVITCPIRFREDWIITDDAASFFFDDGVRWSSLTEVQLTDAYGNSAGDIDVVLVAYDENGKMVDFGAIEVQSAFISGDPRDPFEYYMRDPKGNALMNWTAQSNYPEPDFVKATRESLVPQLIFKGSILNSWHKKMAVAINRSYFETLANLVPVKKEDAEIAWFIYDLELVVEGEKERYQLKKSDVVYTKFQQTLSALTASYPDNVDHFMKLLPEIADR